MVTLTTIGDMVICILAIIGAVYAVKIALFSSASLIYQRIKKKEEIFPGTSSDTPNLKPISIPTRAHSPVKRHAVWLRESRRWQLSDNWTYELEDGTRIILPQGFEFDRTSIPRTFWALLSPVGLPLIPRLIHDYGYKYDQLWQIDANGRPAPYGKCQGKKFWDKPFLDTGNRVNGIRVANWIAWLAVTLGGHAAWKSHRKNNCSPGEPKL